MYHKDLVYLEMSVMIVANQKNWTYRQVTKRMTRKYSIIIVFDTIEHNCRICIFILSRWNAFICDVRVVLTHSNVTSSFPFLALFLVSGCLQLYLKYTSEHEMYIWNSKNVCIARRNNLTFNSLIFDFSSLHNGPWAISWELFCRCFHWDCASQLFLLIHYVFYHDFLLQRIPIDSPTWLPTHEQKKENSRHARVGGERPGGLNLHEELQTANQCWEQNNSLPRGRANQFVIQY